MMVRLPGQAGAKTQKNLERDWAASVCGVENRGLGIQSYVCAQAHLPGASLRQIARSAERIRTDAIGGRQRSCRKQLVLIHQLQPGKGVIPSAKVQRGLQQITVEICAGGDLVHPSPNQRSSPVSTGLGTVVLDRRSLAPLTSRLERLRMLQPSNAVLRRPVACGS